MIPPIQRDGRPRPTFSRRLLARSKENDNLFTPMKAHTGPAPFGFTWDKGRLRVVGKEAQVRRLAFELFMELQSKAAVARRLNAAGHQTRRGGQWRDVTVGRLLECSSARGIYALNKSTRGEAG